MAYTKRDIVDRAFEEIGLGAYVFDLQPEQLDGALRRLDAMMATWNARGLRLGYPLPSSPSESDLDQEMGVPDRALEAMHLNLAVRLSGGYGKTVSPDTRVAARRAYADLIAASSQVIPMSLDATAIPSGAGNYRVGGTYLRQAQDPLTAGADDILDLE